MYVCVFRAGKRAGLFTDEAHAAEISAHPENYWFEGLSAGASAFVPTQLIFGRTRKLNHTLSHREKQEPDAVFIAVITTAQFYEQEKAGAIAFAERQVALRRQIKQMNSSMAQKVRWDDLSAKQQARFHGSNLTLNQCWIWRPLEHPRRKAAEDRKHDEAPYRDFYISIKGPIPKGIVLRHKCHNRQCMNPNHLQLGTYKDNAQDMMRAGRHWRQKQTNPRNAILNAAWTKNRLKKATTLSKQGYSPSSIANKLGNGISSMSVTMRLYYQKKAETKLARRQAYLRRKKRKS